MSEIRYQAGKAGTGHYGPYVGLTAVLAFTKTKVSEEGGIRLKKGAGNDAGPILTKFEAFKRAHNYLEHAEPGDKVVFLPDTGPFNWVIRTARYDPLPEQFLAGVPSIDRIAQDAYSKFNDEYGLVDLGICVPKPGEHGACNAIDIGVSKPKDSDAIHAAILDVGNYLRTKMLADMQGEPGLPVNGVIVMEQICSREDTSWHYYSGVPHVSHVHVSGWPNLVPGWV